MNLKARSKPVHLLKLEALYPRLPDLHPSKSTIEADIAKRSAGYKGE
ncbi:hypothetical protein [Bacillus sp. EB01]|nr:hypothetical protein [Bacillus sp. EB01]